MIEPCCEYLSVQAVQLLSLSTRVVNHKKTNSMKED